MPTFPQLRKDPVVDRWVIIAPERALRPTELAAPSRLRHRTDCPLCEGHEAETPSEVLAIRKPGSQPNGPGWKVRIVANRFPAVRIEAEHAVGVHDVVIECPQHEASIAELPIEQIVEVFAATRDRLMELRRDPRLAYAQVFKNHGAEAGASLEHAHSQILATAKTPVEVQSELDAAERFHRQRGRCVYCDLIERELSSGERVVFAGQHIVAVAAWAGRFPYETWILPRRHVAHFDRLNTAELQEFAFALQDVLRRLSRVAGDPSYNFILHAAPMQSPELPTYHWHWEILPRLTGIAGYELATGSYLNPLPPEDAAERLRSATSA